MMIERTLLWRSDQSYSPAPLLHYTLTQQSAHARRWPVHLEKRRDGT